MKLKWETHYEMAEVDGYILQVHRVCDKGWDWHFYGPDVEVQFGAAPTRAKARAAAEAALREVSSSDVV